MIQHSRPVFLTFTLHMIFGCVGWFPLLSKSMIRLQASVLAWIPDSGLPEYMEEGVCLFLSRMTVGHRMGPDHHY